MVGFQSILLIWCAADNSPTLNEPAHLAAGVHHWETANFSLYRVNPPLVRLIAAAPLMVVGYTADWSMYADGVGDRPEFQIGDAFVTANGHRFWDLLRLGRVFAIPLTILGTVVCFLWAKELSSSSGGGLIAAALWVFDPFVLGHGCLLTPDCHGAALGVAAGYTFWRWLRKPTWREAIVSGLTLGLAECCKTTLIVLLPLWPIIWFADRWCQRSHSSDSGEDIKERKDKSSRNRLPRSLWAEGAMLFFRTLLALYVLNSIYLWQGSGTQLQHYSFVSSMFGGEDTEYTLGVGRNRFAESWLGSIPLPLPQAYVTGIDLQQRDFERYQSRSYLNGQWSESGWWWYYIYVLLLKEPVGALALAMFAVAMLYSINKMSTIESPVPNAFPTTATMRIVKRDLFVVLAPAVAIFVIVSSKTGINEHGRYILPALPYFFVAIGTVIGLACRIAAEIDHSGANAYRPINSNFNVVKSFWLRSLRSTRYVAVLLIVLIAVESVWVWPGSLAFFNFVSGGTSSGPNYLLGSNVDWGQDLGRLNHWVRENPDKRPVFLAYNEVMYDVWELADEELNSWPLEAENRFDSATDQLAMYEQDGYFAIAVGLLYGERATVQRRDGEYTAIPDEMLRGLRHINPVARVGQTIRVFSADQLRAAIAERPKNMPQQWIDFKLALSCISHCSTVWAVRLKLSNSFFSVTS